MCKGRGQRRLLTRTGQLPFERSGELGRPRETGITVGKGYKNHFQSYYDLVYPYRETRFRRLMDVSSKGRRVLPRFTVPRDPETPHLKVWKGCRNTSVTSTPSEYRIKMIPYTVVLISLQLLHL